MVMPKDATQTTVAGVPIDLDNPKVNRRRERRIYYREHFDTQGTSLGWFPTLPLPSDPYHLNYYVNKKHFRLVPPTVAAKQETEEVVGNAPKVREIAPSQPDAITCPVEDCNKIVKSYIGLARHMASVHKLK